MWEGHRWELGDMVDPNRKQIIKPCAILEQTFLGLAIGWPQLRDYTEGELPALREPQGSTSSPHFKVPRGRSSGRELVEPVQGANSP